MQKRRTDVFRFVPDNPVYSFISNTIHIISNSLVLNITMCFASQVGAIKLWCLLWRLYLRDRTARMIFSFWHVFSSKPLTWWLNIPLNIFIALMLCYEQKSKAKSKKLTFSFFLWHSQLSFRHSWLLYIVYGIKIVA